MTQTMFTITEVMDRYPTLTRFGLGLYDQRHCHTAEYASRLAAGRQDLCTHTEQIETACAWIRTYLRPQKRINRRMGSYGLKHVIEASIGYLSNGECIAAMLMVGFAMQPHRPDSPNCWFNITPASLRYAYEVQKAKKRGMPPPAPLSRPKGFRAWIGKHRKADSALGDLARDMFDNPYCCRWDDFETLLRHISGYDHQACPEAIATLKAAHRAYRKAVIHT